MRRPPVSRQRLIPTGGRPKAAPTGGNPICGVSLLPSALRAATSLLRGRQGVVLRGKILCSSIVIPCIPVGAAFRRPPISPQRRTQTGGRPEAAPTEEIQSAEYLSFRLARASPCRSTSLVRGRRGRPCKADCILQAVKRCPRPPSPASRGKDAAFSLYLPLPLYFSTAKTDISAPSPSAAPKNLLYYSHGTEAVRRHAGASRPGVRRRAASIRRRV